MALKKDQTNPYIFYNLAVYYFLDNDLVRTGKCLDKALLLNPAFEDAFLLQYTLVGEKNPADQKTLLTLLSTIQSHNKNLASTNYLKGVILQNQGEYIQAIDSY